MISPSIDDLKQEDCIVLEALSGSRAYGLDTPQSDTDIKGVYIAPPSWFFCFNPVDQISNEKNDIVYLELNKYLQLLSKNNPSAVELLFTPEDSIFQRDSVLNILDTNKVLSKLCRDTFAGYGIGQIKKAKGLNKRIFNPQVGILPSVPDFCFVLEGQQSIPILDWLATHGLSTEGCGLSVLPHVRDGYALFHEKDAPTGTHFNGLLHSFTKIGAKSPSQDVCLSSIPKGMKPRTWLFFNKDDFSRKNREFNEYKEWEAKRNVIRYESTLHHGGGYDAKNMMHTYRLLRMAEEIARIGRPLVRRPDREELLAIKSGSYTYEELLEKSGQMIRTINEAFATSSLPEEPNPELFESWAIEIRRSWYQKRGYFN